MSLTLGELLTSLATAVGIPAEDQEKHLTQELTLGSEVDKEFITKLSKGIFTVASGKSNEDLKKHFFNQTMNGLDAEMVKLMDDLGFTDDDKKKVLDEKSSFKRPGLVANLQKALYTTQIEEWKKKAESGVDPKELEKITGLEEALRKANADAVVTTDLASQELAKVLSDQQNTLQNMALSGYFSQQDYADKGGLSNSDLALIARTKVLDHIQTNSLNLELINHNTGEFKLTTKDGLPYFDQQKEVSAEDLFKKVLTENNYLKQNGGGTAVPVVVAPAANEQANGKQDMASFEAAANGTVADHK